MNFSTLIVISMTLLLTTTASAQIVTAVSPSSPSFEENVSNQEVISEVARIDVSSTTTVHTYKLNSSTTTSAQDIDAIPATSIQISNYIDLFLGVAGVSDCTFDNATQTFTIVSGSTTSLQVAVDSINTL